MDLIAAVTCLSIFLAITAMIRAAPAKAQKRRGKKSGQRDRWYP